MARRAVLALVLLSALCLQLTAEAGRASTEITKTKNVDLFREPNEAEISDFYSWVARVGQKFQLKKLAAAQQQTPSAAATVQPAADGDIQTYIVVDQNGQGQFLTVQDAINSIEKNQKRTTRITIQINAGRYEYVRHLLPPLSLLMHTFLRTVSNAAPPHTATPHEFDSSSVEENSRLRVRDVLGCARYPLTMSASDSDLRRAVCFGVATGRKF